MVWLLIALATVAVIAVGWWAPRGLNGSQHHGDRPTQDEVLTGRARREQLWKTRGRHPFD